MAFRNILIESPAYIAVRNSQLVVHTDADHTIPLEDISALLVENRQSTITAAALSQLGQCGCTVYLCDEKHLPCAVMLPFQQHSRQLSVLRSQMDAAVPLKKQLWQSVVRQKILNQAQCLDDVGNSRGAEALRARAGRVRSGDADNMEATAAQYYFPQLFGGDFWRGDDNGINAGLNYGYAILRGCTARCLAVYGFLPTLGIHHRSALNAFNLADDLMEPFRPVVDLLVYRTMEETSALTPPVKRQLFNCLNLDILSGDQHHSVAYAIERLVQSFGRSLTKGEVLLTLPQLLEQEQHRYE